MTGGSNQRTSGKSKGGRRKEAARGGRGRKAGTRKNPEIGRTGLSAQVVCLLGEILSLPPFSCSCYLKICVCGHALCIVDSKILF